MMASAPMALALAVNWAHSRRADSLGRGEAVPCSTAKAWYGREGGPERTSTEVGGRVLDPHEGGVSGEVHLVWGDMHSTPRKLASLAAKKKVLASLEGDFSVHPGATPDTQAQEEQKPKVFPGIHLFL